MAKFTQDIKPTNDPSYVGLSREIDAPRPNRALGSLFEGIGDAVGGIAATVDNEYQGQISKDLYEGIDPIRNEQGVNQAMEAGEGLFAPTNKQATLGTTGNKPPNDGSFDRSVATLTEAWKQGKVSDGMYYSRLEAFSRQMRARYPGYREVIDQKIQAITGVNPANALRRETIQTMEKKASQAAERLSSEERFKLDHLEDLPANWKKREQEGNPYSFDELVQYVGEKKRERQQVSDLKSTLDLKSKRNELSKAEAVSTVHDIVGIMSNRVFRDSALGAGWKDFESRVMEATKNSQSLSPEQRLQFEQELNRFKAAYELAFDTEMSKVDRPGGKSMRSIIQDESEVKKLKEGYMSRWTTMSDMLLNGQYGLFGAAMRDVEARQNAMYSKLVPPGSLLEKITVIGKTAGGKEAAAALMTRPEIFGPLIDSILNGHAADRITGTGSFTSQLDDLRKTKGKGTANQFNQAITEATRGITDPTSSPEVRKNHAKALYGPAEVGTLDKFQPDDQVKVFTRMVNPQITAALKNDPESFKMYSEWVDRQFSALMTTQMRMIKDTSEGRHLYEITWDDAAKSFLPKLTPAGEKMFAELKAPGQNAVGLKMSPGRAFMGIGGQPDYQKLMGSDWKVLGQLNDGIRAYSSVLEAEKKPVAETLLRKLDEVSPSAPEQSLFDKAWNAIFGTTKEGQDGLNAEQKMQKHLQDRGTKPLPKPGKTSGLIDMDGNDTAFVYKDLKPVAYFVDEGDANHMIEAVNRGQDPVTVAMRYIDVDENEGRDALRGFFKQTLGKDVDPRYTPWCAAWMNGLLQSTGRKGTGSLAARSFLDYGTPTNEPKKGDIVVFSRGSDPSKGHVGLFMGYDENGDIRVLGGNQGNKVGISTYPASRLLGARKPPSPEQMAQQVQAAGGEPDQIAQGGGGSDQLAGGSGKDTIPRVDSFTVDDLEVGSDAMPAAPSFTVPGTIRIEGSDGKMRQPTRAELREILRQIDRDEAEAKRQANAKNKKR